MTFDKSALRPITLPLAAPAAGQRRHYYLFGGVGGNVMALRPTARRLAPRRQGIGVLHPTIAGRTDVAQDLRSVVDFFVEALSEQMDGKPMLLAGYSFGGAIAYEVAVALRRRGAPAGVVMLDTQVAALRRKRHPLVVRSQRLLRRSARRVLEVTRLRKPLPPPPDPMAAGYTSSREEIRSMAGAMRRDRRAYRPQASDTPVVLVRAARPTDQELEFVPSPDLGWSQVTPVTSVIVTPGSHVRMASPPHDEAFAQNLGDALDRLEAVLTGA
ncbi:MAG: alpha/beta fold hydrolase [Pseudomonadota bacterium]